MNKVSELVLSLILIFLGIFLIYVFRLDFIILLKGICGPLFLLIGLIFLLVTIEDLRE